MTNGPKSVTIPLMTSIRLLIGMFLLTVVGFAQDSYEPWSNGPSRDPGYFPIAVWLQSPANAERFKEIGVNLYVGLYKGPTEEQLDRLTKAGMPVICHQNEFGLEQKNNPIIVGWMHGDEPDNAVSLGKGKGYGPPVTPEVVIERYERMKKADPTRPVFLNLGQGVANDNYIGRGVRRRRMEDYPQYVKGADIVSFDIYPVVHGDAEISGKLEYVPRGVKRLIEWTGGEKPVWNCIETTHISNPNTKATPDQVRSEIWMSLIHGSKGIIYFVHEWKPRFREAGLLDDPAMVKGVTEINREIRDLAPVLNSPTRNDLVSLRAEPGQDSVAVMAKQYQDELYIFTVGMTQKPATATFKLNTAGKDSTVEVIGESRSLGLENGEFRDRYSPYEVHLYRIRKGG